MSGVKGIAAGVLALCLGATPLMAAPIAAGDGRQTVDLNGTRMAVFTYRPARCSDPSLLLVFHGNARNARSHRDDARALADRNCLLLVAPSFDRRDFPVWRYQRGGIVKDGVVQNPRDWSGTLVPALVDWVRRQEGRPLEYSLLGHSAGGQFLDRLAAFVPTEARRIVVANPGSYVAPSWRWPHPMGWERSMRRRTARRGCGAISNGPSPSSRPRRHARRRPRHNPTRWRRAPRATSVE